MLKRFIKPQLFNNLNARYMKSQKKKGDKMAEIVGDAYDERYVDKAMLLRLHFGCWQNQRNGKKM